MTVGLSTIDGLQAHGAPAAVTADPQWIADVTRVVEQALVDDRLARLIEGVLREERQARRRPRGAGAHYSVGDYLKYEDAEY